MEDGADIGMLDEESTPVVVIEDDPDIRALIRSVLTRGGYEVHVACCGLDGLALVAAVRPVLVTLDVGLPDIDGYEVLRRLRADPATVGLPVLLLTARSQGVEPAEPCDFLAKPFRPRELRGTVAALIAAPPVAT